MAYRAFEARKDDATEINLTPLIDVSLVLVVMLLLATPLAFESSIAVRRGEEGGQRSKQSTEAPQIELVVTDDEHVEVNGLSVRVESLGKILDPLLEDEPLASVVVRCDENVAHGAFVGVIDEAKASGAAAIAVARSTRRS